MDFTQPSQACQLNDAGVALVVQIVDPSGAITNIISATSMSIKIKMPDGSTKDFAAILLTNGTDGKMYYVTQPGDLNQVGTYQIQGKLNIAGGLKSSFTGTFNVLDNIDTN